MPYLCSMKNLITILIIICFTSAISIICISHKNIQMVHSLIFMALMVCGIFLTKVNIEINQKT